MIASVSEVQGNNDGAIVFVVVGGIGTKDNYLKNGKWKEKYVAEIYLKISYSFPCHRIPVCVTVIRCRQYCFLLISGGTCLYVTGLPV